MVSIKEVADHAGVSTATVSYLINGSNYVAEATAARIRESIAALGYVSRAVRPGPKPKLSTGIKNGNIMFLSMMPFDVAEMFRMPAFPILLGSIQNAVAKAGMNLLLAHAPDARTPPPALLSGKADGVILMGQPERMSGAFRKALEKTPAVWTFRGPMDPDGHFDHVFYDNRLVGGLAVNYFHRRGLRRLGCINPSMSHPAFVMRATSFERNCEALEVRPIIYQGNVNTTPFSQDEMRTFITKTVDRMLTGRDAPQGIFCVSDDILLHVYRQLETRGVKASDKFDLLGCNNESAMLDQMHPRPATIDLRFDEVGSRTVERLLARMARPDESTIEILVRPVLVPAEEQSAPPVEYADALAAGIM